MYILDLYMSINIYTHTPGHKLDILYLQYAEITPQSGNHHKNVWARIKGLLTANNH